MILPADLYDYADDHPQRRGASLGSSENDPSVGRIAVIDDWPEYISVTEAEVDVFERYFGDVLDRLLGTPDLKQQNQGLHKLTPDVNYKP
ncbi:hypothetical protein FY145_10265 [Agrobacterium tumefaciens]|uniref:Uncharacterized protein n=1 Tax=Agrobacterium tumefaciens TaxID=358 RepID=A0AAP9E4B8_AGRTU|nr:hypothetical protein [Agrobacterium tumefaciens]NSZ58404.1 hypothetical protein [Agrobacterium tumefaciens]QDY94486.1 hypothetical protein CG010_010375 [Agrobacterium tumefaciens]UXS47695.1 hypothetical protein FY149_20675 [Agrobacterium tumefaciens]UXS68973.1 hypothetical protein FY146_10265 [Agrobacterium tumefaciens]UXS76636.1 hypothetical protein FY145_10265 [Agrobacterium tumefaciens]